MAKAAALLCMNLESCMAGQSGRPDYPGSVGATEEYEVMPSTLDVAGLRSRARACFAHEPVSSWANRHPAPDKDVYGPGLRMSRCRRGRFEPPEVTAEHPAH